MNFQKIQNEYSTIIDKQKKENQQLKNTIELLKMEHGVQSAQEEW